MRRTTVSVLLMLLLAGLAWGQEPQKQLPNPKPEVRKDAPPVEKPAAKAPTLEELLAKAMKDNPDVRVAEAKLREAEAELNRTRLQVMQKVIVTHRAYEAQKALLESTDLDHKRITGTFSKPEEREASKQKLLAAKAKLAEIEAELPYLTGKQPAQVVHPNVSSIAFSPDGKLIATTNAPFINQWLPHPLNNLTDNTLWISTDLVRVWDAESGKQVLGVKNATPPVAANMAEKIRKAMDTPIQGNYRDTEASAFLKDLEQRFQGVPFIVLAKPLSKELVNLRFDVPVPVGAWLQAFQDIYNPELRFIVRDYGILVTQKTYVVPAGATTLHDFWKSPPPAPKEPAASPKKQ